MERQRAYPRRVRHLVSKTEIDALVTIAIQWTQDGHVDAMPEPARTVLRVTSEIASDVGRRLWQANAGAFYFGGPPEGCDPDVREEAQAELGRDYGTPFVAVVARTRRLPPSLPIRWPPLVQRSAVS